MQVSSDFQLYLSAVLAGALLAVLDRAWLKRWIIAGLLLAGVIGGYLITVASPFSFGGTSYYMEGVILSAGSALALCGYAAAAIAHGIWKRVRA